MDIFRVVFGGALVAAGRRMFWLFVAGIGFMVGLQLADRVLTETPVWVNLLLALGAGLVGATAAVLLQRVGVGLAGFLVGVYIAFGLVDLIAPEAGSWQGILYLTGGILGAILMSVVFDWALIVLSTIAGAVLLVQGLGLSLPWSGIVFFGLLLVGIILQGRALGGKGRSRQAA